MSIFDRHSVVKNPHGEKNLNVHHRAYNSKPMVPTASQMDPVHTLISYSFKINFMFYPSNYN
jgi:hypothetical protein